MHASNSTIRTLKDEFLEEYEPMTSLYWKKNKKPNIDIRVSPFALDRQLEDQKFSMIYNRNPRGAELTKGEKLRSEKFVKRSDPSALKTKAHVINKIVREVSGVHTYALIPPIERKDTRVKEVVDPDTHPMMKPYRDESMRNPVMCSFGHRPRSASRTFHPATMNFRLRHEEVAAVAGMGKSGFGLQPAVLAKLLHAPPLSNDRGESESQSQSQSQGRGGRGSVPPPPPSRWEDPHNLFLSSEDVFDRTAATSSSSSVSVLGQSSPHPLGPGGGLEHSRSWNATSFSDHAAGNDLNGVTSNSFESFGRRKKKTPKNKNPDKILDPSGWNNHFQVMERHSNENFELRKSGIAELKLMPLKERLTRFAQFAVRESRPDPFCAEKKQTDALLLAGKATSPGEVYDKQANPFYDAEVEEDIRLIQQKHDVGQENFRKKQAQKKHKANMKTIPHCDYHPDLAVLSMHRMSEEEAMTKSESEALHPVEFQSVGDLYNSFSPAKPSEQKPVKPTRSSRTKGTLAQEKIRFFALNYLGEDVDATSIGGSTSKAKKKPDLIFNVDRVFDHVMQPFDDYFGVSGREDEDENENEDETDAQGQGRATVRKKEVRSEEDEYRAMMVEQEAGLAQDAASLGSDITEVLQQQAEEGKARGFRETEGGYDYDNMLDDLGGRHDHDDLHYNEDLLEGAGHDHQPDPYNDDDEHEHEHEHEHAEEEEEFTGGVGLEKSEFDVGASHSVVQPDEMFQSSFVNQKHHTTMMKDDSRDEQQREYDETEGGGEEDDVLDNPRVLDDTTQYMAGDEDQDQDHEQEQEQEQEEQGEYEGGDEEDGNAWEGGGGGDQDFDEQGQGQGEQEQEEQEHYDDDKLDFGNGELEDDGMFTEKQH